MKKYFNISLFVISILLFASCPTDSNSNFTYDPDPAGTEEILDSPDEDLYIIANIDGKIYGFYSSKPEDYKELASDACTDTYYSNMRISDDLNYLLFAKNNGTAKDLVLKNLNTGVETILASGVASNESEFIDNDSVIFTDDGYIDVYNVGETAYTLVPHEDYRCNHWGMLSPELDKIVFKEQDWRQEEVALHAYTYITLGQSNAAVNEITEYYSDTYDTPVDLYDSFFYCWRDNDSVIFKNKPGDTNRLYEKNVETNSYRTSAQLVLDGMDALFTELVISPNRENLLMYGHYGVYLIDLVSNSILTGTLEPIEVYTSTSYKTLYAAFGSDSGSFVLGTENWIGIYNTDGAAKTNVSLSDVIGDYGTLYALYCR